MTTKEYPTIYSDNPSDLALALREITRIRRDDITEYDILYKRLSLPENVAKAAICKTQFDKAGSTTLGDVTDLSLNVTEGIKYRIRAVLFYDADATGGHKYTLSGTATATDIIYNINSINNSTNAYVITARQTALDSASGQAGSTAGVTYIEGYIDVSASGTITVQFAQNANSGTSSILVGSYIEILAEV